MTDKEHIELMKKIINLKYDMYSDSVSSMEENNEPKKGFEKQYETEIRLCSVMLSMKYCIEDAEYAQEVLNILEEE